MSEDVQFDMDTQNAPSRRVAPTAGFGQTTSETSGMAGWLIRHHLAKTPAAAQGLMVAVILVDIVAIFVLIKFFL